MRNTFTFLFCLCWMVQAGAQTSIYTCGIYPTITQTQIENAGPEFNLPCVILDQIFDFNGSSNKAITSPTSVHIKPGFHAGNYGPSGGMHIGITPKSLFDVAAINYGSLEYILRYEKLELGVDLPADILQKVNNFVNGSSEPKINPYLEWELKVEAQFTKAGQAPIKIDGYYSKDYVSEMVETLPVPANDSLEPFPYYTDEEYWSLGSWTEVPSTHPFRIRFAPPTNGEWSCIVKIYEGENIYESNEFIFNVIESGNPGYMKVDPGQRFLSYNNKTFIPLGCNLPWPVTSVERDPDLEMYLKYNEGGIKKDRPEDYRHYGVLPRVYDKYKDAMRSLADNGANYFRTVMYPTATEIEWEKAGDYTKRLYMAQEMDDILKVAETKNVFLHWDFQIHYSFQYAAAAYGKAWTWNYTSPSGPFCYKTLIGSDTIPGNDNPVRFLTHEESKKYYKQRLRYLLARYGYSTNIAVFELFSEISNVGANKADNSDYYKTGDNWTDYRDWQVEMAKYVKSQYNGAIHMVTGSYAGPKHPDDDTYQDPNMEIMTSNLYDWGAPDYADEFWTKDITGNYLNDNCPNVDSYTTECLSDAMQHNIKPMIISESGVIDVDNDCKFNHVEHNRSLWQSLFSGVAGALSWTQWNRIGNYGIYQQMNDFISQFENLGAENWHPGASWNTSGKWVYSEDWANEMGEEASKADVMYLRSGDRNYAIGVITNKTYNVYNTSDCFDQKWDAWSNDTVPEIDRWDRPNKVLQPVNVATEGLKLQGMKMDKYYVNYFYPDNLSVPFHSTDDIGPKVKLDVTIPASYGSYIVLFMARRKDHSWIDVAPNSSSALDNAASFSEISTEPREGQEPRESANGKIDIDVFPVPAHNKVTIEAEQHQGKVDVLVESMDGKMVEKLTLKGGHDELDISRYEPGTYFLKFQIQGIHIETRKIIKL